MENSAPQEKFPINEESLKKFNEILDKQANLISAGIMTKKESENFARVVNQQKFKGGEALFDAGSKAEKVFLLYEGELIVQRTVQDDKTFKISLYPGQLFGDVAAILNRDRSAAVLAKEDSVCLTFSKENYLNHIGKKMKDWFLAFFNRTELFKDTDEYIKEAACLGAAIQIYQDGEVIIKKVGIKGNNFFSYFLSFRFDLPF